MIYGANGQILTNAYDKSGNALHVAYDKDGEVVFTDAKTIIKVMTYNVGGWYTGEGTNVPANEKEAYYALQTGMILNDDPDVLLIQEYLADFSADDTSARTMLESLFPYVHTEVSGTYYGRAICSKYPITNYTIRKYVIEQNRYFDSCIITINEKPITFITTHLGLNQEQRTSEIEQLIGFLIPLGAFVCGGDFNTGITPAQTTESSSYINNVKPFKDEGFNMANFSETFMVTHYSGDGISGSGSCLDNIIVSENVAVTQKYVDTTKKTDSIVAKIDHMPLIAELEII